MNDPVIVLDSGVLDQVPKNREFRAVLEDLVSEGWVPLVPTVVLAEAISGRATDAPVNHVVQRVGTVDTDQATARRAGRLRASAARIGGRRAPGAIDAIVAAHAVLEAHAVVFTSDPADLKRLLVDHPTVSVQKP